MTKNLKIREDTHTKVKTYCSRHKLMLNDWVDQLIQLNFQHQILIELSEQNTDIEYLLRKMNSPKTDYAGCIKIKKQIKLLEDSKEIFIKTHLDKWRPL